MNPALVLNTVNAPYSHKLDAHALAHYLLDLSVSKMAAAEVPPGHMSAFFGEVKPKLQIEFADMYDISSSQLALAAKAFGEYSGETYPLAA